MKEQGGEGERRNVGEKKGEKKERKVNMDT